MQIELRSDALLSVIAFPPGTDQEAAHFHSGFLRLLRPRQGVWRIRVQCGTHVNPIPVPQSYSCEDAMYRARATVGTLGIPKAVAHRQDGKLIPMGSLTSPIPHARLVEVGEGAWEPTIGVTRSGWILYQADSGPRRSKDGGKTWHTVSPKAGPISRHPIWGDGSLYVDEGTSRVFTYDWLWSECSELSFSDDGGTTWTTSGLCGHTDFPKVFAGPPVSSPTVGYPNIVYYCAANGGISGFSAGATCSKSLDGGLTFVPTGSAPYLVDPNADQAPPQCYGGAGNGVVGPRGTVYLAQGPGWCGEPFVVISHDEGATWTRVEVARFGISGAADVAVDRRGTVYYTWVAGAPYLAVSRNGGTRWSKPMMIGPPGIVDASFPSIDVGAPGKIAVSFMGTENGSDWNGYITMSESVLGPDPVFLTAPVNDPSDPLVGGSCGGVRCGGAGDYFDVAIGPDGTPWAAFVDTCAGPSGCEGIGGGVGVVGRLIGGPSLR